MVSFSSNNNLALAHDPRIILSVRRGLEQHGIANCEPRLLGGDIEVYLDLERKLAELKGEESAILFATGYLTNLGVLSALPWNGMLQRVDGFRPSKRYKHASFSDESNHTSIREDIALSGPPKLTYAHCDMDDLRKKLASANATAKIIISDGVFSMDGGIAPLPQFIGIADQFDATLHVDKTHGTGLIGANGGGVVEHFAVNSPRLISMGTPTKAYGAIGGFIATENYISETLRFTSSAYGFTSTMHPDQAFAFSTALDIVKNELRRRDGLCENERYFVKKVE